MTETDISENANRAGLSIRQPVAWETVDSGLTGTHVCMGQPLDKLAFIALWGFVFSVPFETTLMIPSVGTISRLMGLASLPLVVVALIARNGWRKLLPAHLWMLAFVLWGGVTYFWSANPEASYDRFATEVQLFVITAMMWQFTASRGAAKSLAAAYVIGTVVASAETLTRFASHLATSWGRYYAAGLDPNDLSVTLALSIPVSYCFFLVSGRWTGLLCLCQISLAVFSCLLTASRAGAVATGLALGIVLLTAKALTTQKRYALTALIAGMAGLEVWVVPPTTWQRLNTIATEVKSGTLNSRTEIWNGGLEEALKHPIAGVGAGAFSDAVEPTLSFYDDDHAFVAHNTFISVLTERGTIGFLLFLSLLLSVCMSANSAHDPILRRCWILTLAVWAVGVSTLTWEHRKPTWVMFALILQTRSMQSGKERTRPMGRIAGMLFPG